MVVPALFLLFLIISWLLNKQLRNIGGFKKNRHFHMRADLRDNSGLVTLAYPVIPFVWQTVFFQYQRDFRLLLGPSRRNKA